MRKILFVVFILFLFALGARYLVGLVVSSRAGEGAPSGRDLPGKPLFSVCTADAKICPDGTAVGRDGTNNCEFYPCPDQEEPAADGPVACTADARVCSDGSAVGRDGERGCAFHPCPDEGTVTGRLTLAPTCPYETVFDKPCPTEPYEGDVRLAPAQGGKVEIVDVRGGTFYATLPPGTYSVSSGRVLPRCDGSFTVAAGGATSFSLSCDSGVR